MKLSRGDLLNFALVFVAFLATAKAGQYVFFAWHITPAVIWLPSGIALAAVLAGGYRMGIPIALAALVTVTTSTTMPPLSTIVVATVAYTLEPMLGAYVLRRLGFLPSFDRLRNTLTFSIVIFFIAAIVPTLVSGTQFFTHTLSDPFFISWSRSWAGRVLSFLVLTPLILSWIAWRPRAYSIQKSTETVGMFTVLVTSIYFLFWTSVGTSYSFVLLVLMLVMFFWMALRLDIRAMTLAIFILTALGMAGVLFGSGTSPLNQRLFSIELFVILITPIFYLFSTLVRERKTTTQELASNMRQLEEALKKVSTEDQLKSEFIAILAHELRNPLAAMVTTIDVLMLEEQAPQTKELLEGAQQQAHAMRRLLEDLLDVARVVQKKFKLQRETIELSSAISFCISSTKSVIESRNHTLSVLLPKEKVWLYVDPLRFNQVIINLLNNSAKYTDAGGQIELSARVHGAWLEIRIRDNGIGIPSDKLEEIFEPFRQIRSNPRISTGLGIGLSLVKRLTELHGGTVHAHSDGLGSGSIFTLSLPLAPKESMPVEKNTVSHKNNLPVHRVLVVDDNEAAADGLRRLLAALGQEVSVAHTGQETLAVVSALEPEIILLDIGLPDMDGYEVARQLRRQGFSKTLVALTGYGQEEDKTLARHAGFDEHLTKPIGIAEITKFLSSAR